MALDRRSRLPVAVVGGSALLVCALALVQTVFSHAHGGSEAVIPVTVKRFEYSLRRKVEGNSNQVLLSGSDEVPDQFRKLVEQYYRSLSKAPDKPGDKAADKAPDKK